jgi:hypothetical protein
MKQPKWIETMDAVDHWEAGYWVKRGWDREGRMRSISVIDSIATGAKYASVEGQLTPVGGISHAGARGISRVEVRIDAGEWQPATLREPLSDTSWVVWRADLPLQGGDHTVAVRCYERDGTPQTGPIHRKHVQL